MVPRIVAAAPLVMARQRLVYAALLAALFKRVRADGDVELSSRQFRLALPSVPQAMVVHRALVETFAWLDGRASMAAEKLHKFGFRDPFA